MIVVRGWRVVDLEAPYGFCILALVWHLELRSMRFSRIDSSSRSAHSVMHQPFTSHLRADRTVARSLTSQNRDAPMFFTPVIRA
jgi:hypothetical protein